jgi:hypothetical protein
VTEDTRKFLTNGGLMKFLAILTVFLFTIGAGIIFIIEVLSNQTINSTVVIWLSIILGAISNILGFHTSGVSHDTSTLVP